MKPTMLLLFVVIHVVSAAVNWQWKRGDGVSRTSRYKLWSNSIPYYITFDFQQEDINEIANAMNEVMSKTCLRFVQRTTEHDYIMFMKGSGCYSTIGRVGGVQHISLGSNCVYKGLIIHEIMHTLGFFHEHLRFDRDDYVNIYLDNVIPGTEDNFEKYNRDETDLMDQPYDYYSLMHYSERAFTKNGGKTIEAKDFNVTLLDRSTLSSIDQIKINMLYQCATTDTTRTCLDVSPSCPSWSLMCSTNDFVKKACQATCNTCQDIKPEPNCNYWKQIGHCSKDATLMRVLCEGIC
jgi:hypothetical protein